MKVHYTRRYQRSIREAQGINSDVRAKGSGETREQVRRYIQRNKKPSDKLINKWKELFDKIK